MTALALILMAVAIGLLWRRVDALEHALQQARLPDTAVVEAPGVPAPVAPEVEAPARSGPRMPAWRPRFDLEDVFGRMLPIWAGGVTLAVAGFFLVRWAIDAGLLSPAVRVLLAGLFGLALLAGAEAAYRWRERVADPRVAQALAGAGLATLYAAFYLAGTTYGLIGATVAFLGLATVTGAAIALSWRFGLPSAVLGLIGGFAAPALIGGEQANLPLLTLYLGLVTAGLALTGRRQDRGWLGLAALGAGLVWGALLVARAGAASADVVVLGGYLVLLGAVVPAMIGASARLDRGLRAAAAGLAAVQLAALVAQGGFGALQWALYLLLGAALAGLGWRNVALREGGALAAAVAAGLLALWSDPPAGMFGAVMAGLAAIFAGVPLALMARRRHIPIDGWQIAGLSVALGAVWLWQFGAVLPARPDGRAATVLAALALLPAAGALLLHRAGEHGAHRQAMEAAAVLLGYGALAQVLPHDALAWVAAAGAIGIALRWPHRHAALATAGGLAALWALGVIGHWLEPATAALAGSPLAAEALPSARTIVLRLLPLVAALAVWLWRAAPQPRVARAVATGFVLAVTVAAHTLYRHAFAAIAGSDFVTTGLIQRAGWDALLAGAAWLFARRAQPGLARVFAVAALAHFGWFTLALHNPLWAAQAVGPWPIVNALIPAYGAGFAALAVARRVAPAQRGWQWAADAATMLAIVLFALSQLRQLFAGSLLTAVPVGQGEDLLRSLGGIVIAIGFLLWGARRGGRSWRIGSLMLMVLAVLKVFLVDAAGLGGLARIASFMALGFSLIGIGWFYSRQLRRTPAAEGVPAAVT